jgi:hypothetical protein
MSMSANHLNLPPVLSHVYARVLNKAEEHAMESSKTDCPFSACGPLATHMILSSLDPVSLLSASLVCRSWKALAYDDQGLWAQHCEVGEADVAHVLQLPNPTCH